MSCERPFWNDPAILFSHFSLEYEPSCQHSPWNFIARLVILSFFMGLIGSAVAGLQIVPVMMLFGVITAFVIIMTTPAKPNRFMIKEHPEDTNSYDSQMKHYKDAKKHPQQPSSKDKKSTQPQLPSISENDVPVTIDFSLRGLITKLFSRGEPAQIKPDRPIEMTPDKSSYKKLPYVTPTQPQGYIAPTFSEHFVNGGSAPGSVQPVPSYAAVSGVVEVDASPYSGAPLPDHTPPTSRNPFMNVLLEEMKYNPHRGSAESVSDPIVKQTFDDFFRVQWFSDPTDVFGKNQSQRQYVTQPSTTVPNDQGAFADWLYKIPGKTCKEGGRAACYGGTDGAVIPWLNVLN